MDRSRWVMLDSGAPIAVGKPHVAVLVVRFGPGELAVSQAAAEMAVQHALGSSVAMHGAFVPTAVIPGSVYVRADARWFFQNVEVFFAASGAGLDAGTVAQSLSAGLAQFAWRVETALVFSLPAASTPSPEPQPAPNGGNSVDRRAAVAALACAAALALVVFLGGE